MVDISNRNDIVNLLDTFYKKATIDSVIGEKFNGLKMDHHLQIIADFWDSVLFGHHKYQGDPFGKHRHLDLSKVHFERWIKLFFETVDEMFAGQKATEAKQRASTISQVFQFKLKSLG